ncbi:MAG: SDR family oxidoreductase [Bacteroidota bacterium]
MKTLAIFGASGQTGQHVLRMALEKGYRVKALARTPEKITQQSPLLSIIQGDVLNAHEVEKTIEGTDVVLSLFGHVKGSPEWLQTNGTQNIVAAMKQHGVAKIISLSGGGLPFPEKDQPKFTDHLIRGIMKLFVPKVLSDAIRHHEVLAGSGLDWTIVRGPRLTNDPAKGAYRVGWVGVNAGTKVSRADLAAFILTQVENPEFVHQMPFVTH